MIMEKLFSTSVFGTLSIILLSFGLAAQPTNSTVKLTQLEVGNNVEGTRAGQIGLTGTNGLQRYAQYTEIDLTPIAFTPTSTGNVTHLSEFVIDPTGDIFYIDWQGRGLLLKEAGTVDKNGIYSGNLGNGGDETVPSSTTSTLTNQYTLYAPNEDSYGGTVPFRIQVDGDDKEYMSYVNTLSLVPDSLYLLKQDDAWKWYAPDGFLSIGSGLGVILNAPQVEVITMPIAAAGEHTFTMWAPGKELKYKEGIEWDDLLGPVQDSITNGYNTDFSTSGALGFVDITDGNSTLSIPTLDIAPVQSLSSPNGTIAITTSPGGIRLLDLAQQGATSGQVLAWNGTSFAPANQSVTGDWHDGGNAATATFSGGTTTDFATELKTNNVTRASISSAGTAGGNLTLTGVTANTTTVQDRLSILTNSTGTPGVGFGGGILFQAQSSTTPNRDICRLSPRWTVATDGSRDSKIGIQLVSSGNPLSEMASFDSGTNGTGGLNIGSSSTLVITNAKMQTAATFTIGNSSSILNLGGSNGNVTINTSAIATMKSTAASALGVQIYSDNNTASTTGNISIGGVNSYTQTSGTRNYMNFDYSFSPTSGNAVHNSLVFTGTMNQTGGANGPIRRVYDNSTLTAVADYTSFQTDVNTANAIGFRQTGATSTNRFVGKTAFGSTTTPTRMVDITGNIAVSDLTATPTTLVGRDGSNVLGNITLGTNLSITAGTLNAAASDVTTASNGLTEVGNDIQLGGTATATNTIDWANFSFINTFNTIGSGSGLKLTSTSTAAAGNTQKVLEVDLSGANATSTQTTYGMYASNSHSGTNPANIGIFGSSTNGVPSTSAGVSGSGGGAIPGVLGTSVSGPGISGVSTSGNSVTGSSTSGNGGNFTSSTSNALTATVLNSNSQPALLSTVLGSNTTATKEIIRMTSETSGTAGTGHGGIFGMYNEVSDGNTFRCNSIISKLTNATVGTRTADMIFTGINSTVESDLVTFVADGSIKAHKYGVGTFTGTAATIPAFTSAGVIIETAVPLNSSATLDFGSTSAGTSSDLTITVTGAADGDVVGLGTPNGSTLSNGTFTTWVSAADTVTVRFTNTNLVTALDPASGTFKVRVFK